MFAVHSHCQQQLEVGASGYKYRSMNELPVALQLLLLQQENLLTRPQLTANGVSAWKVADLVAQQKWSLVTSRVVKLDVQPLTRQQERIAASLHFDELVLTGIAALEIEGFEETHDKRIDLIGPRGGRLEPALNVVIHTSRRSIALEDGFPRRTTNALSVVHAMAWAETLLKAQHIAYWSVRQGLVTLNDLYFTVLNNKRSQIMKTAFPRVFSLREQIDTVHEHLFLNLCRQHQLPEPIRKQQFESEQGVILHSDFAFKVGDRLLAIEIDGIQHFTDEGLKVDEYRMQVFAAHGADTMRISNRELVEQPLAVMRALRFRLQHM